MPAAAAPLAVQIERTDALIVIGDGRVADGWHDRRRESRCCRAFQAGRVHVAALV
jgi:hypothetical protein